MPIYSLEGIAPNLVAAKNCWIAPDANLIGKVELGEEVSIWFGATLRGDNEPLIIGARSNIQENCVLHTDIGLPLEVGEDCTIGHRVILHSCTIGANSLIGMGSVILNGAKIGSNCLVGASALVTENKVFEDGMLILGAPARAVRPLSIREKQKILLSASHYVANSQRMQKSMRRLVTIASQEA